MTTTTTLEVMARRALLCRCLCTGSRVPHLTALRVRDMDSSLPTNHNSNPTLRSTRRFYHATRITLFDHSATASTAAAAAAAPEQKRQWQELFPPAQFVSVWETPRRDEYFGSLEEDDKALDTASRHVIAGLQRLYRTGYIPTQSIITRDWCHYVLQQLGDAPAISLARIQRARALLAAMRLMETMDSMSVAYELPRPNARTYRLVLDMYTRVVMTDKDISADAALAVAHETRDLVVRMEQDYRTAADLSMRPTVVEWNRVLQVYAQQPHEWRAQHAVQDVLFPHMLNADNLVVDGSSLLFFLRACGFQVPSEQAAVRGAWMATVVWERLMRDKAVHERVMPMLLSQFYSLFMQTIRHLPPSDQREQVFAEAFEHAKRAGKLNSIIVKEFLMHAKPKKLVERVLGADRLAKVVNLKPTVAAQKLLEDMPAEWSANQDSNYRYSN